MSAGPSSYRLETAIRRLYDLRLGPLDFDRLCVRIKFLDFPDILVRPETAGSVLNGGAVNFNVCHRAEFQLSDEQCIVSFPARCFCELVKEGARFNKSNPPQDARWVCPCPLEASVSEPRTYSSFPILDSRTGDTVGYADMSCRVVPDAADNTSPAVAANVASSSVPVPPLFPPQRAGLDGGGGSVTPPQPGRPYIVRVVVNNKDRQTSDSAPNCSTARLSQSRRHGAAPVRPLATHTATDEETLLYVLEYDVACQLQSFTECLATTLKREHSALNAVARGARSSTLTAAIDADVKKVFKVSNIVLQIANQLIDGSDVPERTGTTRLSKDPSATVKRNPINKLPLPKHGSVYQYLLYDVLFQLQCLGTNLSYLVAVYPSALDTPLKKLPDSHVAFCRQLKDAVQSLVRNVNVLTQSAIDGRYHKDGAPTESTSPPETADKTSTKKRTKGSKAKKKEKRTRSKSASRRKARSPSTSTSSSSFSGSSRTSSASSSSSSFSSASSNSSRSSRVASTSSRSSSSIFAKRVHSTAVTTATPPLPFPVAQPAPSPSSTPPAPTFATVTVPPAVQLTSTAGGITQQPPSHTFAANATTPVSPAPQPMPMLGGGNSSNSTPPSASPISLGDRLAAFRFGGGGDGSSMSRSTRDSRANSFGGPIQGVTQPPNFNASGSLGAIPLGTTSAAVPQTQFSAPNQPTLPPTLSIPSPTPRLAQPQSLQPPVIPNLSIPIPPPLSR